LLTDFIKGTKKTLAIYDPQVSDRSMMHILEERAKAGVNVRIIGRLVGKIPGVEAHKLPQMRLHTRTMVRDGKLAFLGSQSLREAELESRREVGLIFQDKKIVAQMIRCFESDWALVERAEEDPAAVKAPAEKLAKKVAKAVTRDLPPVAPLVTDAVQEVAGDIGQMDLSISDMEATVRGAVKEAVKEAVKQALDRAAARAE
jgi:cardiolipin synthase